MNKQGPRGDGPGKWIQESERAILETPFMSVYELTCHSSEARETSETNAKRLKFYTMRARNWCNIIPVTEDGKIVLVRQYRIGIAQHTTEIPGGVVDPQDPHVQATAIREMTEETGYVPVPGARCETLGWSFPNPAIQNNIVTSLIVGPVRKSQDQNLDEGEMIETFEVAISEIPKLISDGTINHALMLDTFFFLLMRQPGAGSLLEKGLKEYAQAPA